MPCVPYVPSCGGGVGVPECAEWVDRIEWEERRGMVAPPSCGCGYTIPTCKGVFALF